MLAKKNISRYWNVETLIHFNERDLLLNIECMEVNDMCRGTTNWEDVYIIKEDCIPSEILNKLNKEWIKNHGGIPVDLCIGEEVENLILKGITTLGSCCGHNEYQSHVLIHRDQIKKVTNLGYKVKKYRWDLYEVHLKSGSQIII